MDIFELLNNMYENKELHIRKRIYTMDVYRTYLTALYDAGVLKTRIYLYLSFDYIQ